MNIKNVIKHIDSGLPEEINNIFNSSKSLSINDLQKLKLKYPDIPLADLLNIQALRIKAKKKFPDSFEMFFTQKGYEQASSHLLSSYHAEMAIPFSSYADLCCGIGSDLRKMALNKNIVFAHDTDIDTLACAQYNSRMHSNISFSNLPAARFNKKVDLIFADPDRRPSKKRTISPQQILPSFNDLLEMITKKNLCDTLMLKLPPALDYISLETTLLADLLPKYRLFYSWQFISESATLKEILLTVSKKQPEFKRKAVLLPQKNSLTGCGNESIPLNSWDSYLFEPDNAVIRSGLVQKLGSILNYSLIDPHIALLTGNHIVNQRFGKLYEIMEILPWNVKTIQRYLKIHDIGELVIKTRGFPKTAEELHKQFKLKGNNKLIIFIVRINNSHQVAVLKQI